MKHNNCSLSEKNLSAAVDYLKESGLQIIACTEKAKEEFVKLISQHRLQLFSALKKTEYQKNC